jgi:hypothetical protein
MDTIKTNLQIYTAQYRYSGEDRLDITTRSSTAIFAPTNRMLYDHKYKGLPNEKYTDLYYKLMRLSYVNHREEWEEVLEKERVTFVCFCSFTKEQILNEPCFCHRFLLKDMFIRLGATYVEEIIMKKKGEV